MFCTRILRNSRRSLQLSIVDTCLALPGLQTMKSEDMFSRDLAHMLVAVSPYHNVSV